jgi:7-cyano-7-deazaguanine synthase
MILLFSAGIDSYVAWHYLQFPKTVYFHLNTPYSNREMETVKYLIPDTIIDRSLDLGFRQYGVNAYVPFRNLYLTMLAHNYCMPDENGRRMIVIAGLKDDKVRDKNEGAFGLFGKVLSEIEDQRILVHSPFWNLTKSAVVEWFLKTHPEKKNDLILTISCYSGTESYCGRCPSCFRKWNALWDNKIHLGFFDEQLMSQYYNRANTYYYIPERNESIIRCVEEFRSGKVQTKNDVRGSAEAQKEAG